MDIRSYIITLLIVWLSAIVVAQFFKIKKLRKMENDEGEPVYVEFTDGDTQVVKGVGTVRKEAEGITLRAPDCTIVATLNPKLIRAIYVEHAVTADEDSE